MRLESLLGNIIRVWLADETEGCARLGMKSALLHNLMGLVTISSKVFRTIRDNRLNTELKEAFKDRDKRIDEARAVGAFPK